MKKFLGCDKMVEDPTDVKNVFDGDTWGPEHFPDGMINLFYGDCHDVIGDPDYSRNYRFEHHIRDESIDLIYMDPPFNSDETYNLIFADGRETQLQAYKDTWERNDKFEKERSMVFKMNNKVAKLITGFEGSLDTSDSMVPYLVFMALRLIESHKLLKSTGSICVHCDQTAGHYIKTVLDAIYGRKNFRNEIIWHYAGTGRPNKIFKSKHDIIFFYSKTSDWKFNVELVPIKETSINRFNKIDEKGRYKEYGIDSKGQMRKVYMEGNPRDDVWDISIIGATARERLGYPTQKPETLLERIIRAFTNKGDTILDPFCGGGTTLVVADRLDRKWIGIDITYSALEMTKHRFKINHKWIRFGPIDGFPKTYEDIEHDFLDLENLTEAEKREKRLEFQWVVLGLVGARPYGPMKIGPDEGVDGVKTLEFLDDQNITIIYQVKSGKINSKWISDLSSAIIKQHGDMGVLISRNPIEELKTEASKYGSYRVPGGIDEEYYPKIQLFELRRIMESINKGERSPIKEPGLPNITLRLKTEIEKIEEEPKKPQIKKQSYEFDRWA